MGLNEVRVEVEQGFAENKRIAVRTQEQSDAARERIARIGVLAGILQESLPALVGKAREPVARSLVILDSSRRMVERAIGGYESALKGVMAQEQKLAETRARNQKALEKSSALLESAREKAQKNELGAAVKRLEAEQAAKDELAKRTKVKA